MRLRPAAISAAVIAIFLAAIYALHSCGREEPARDNGLSASPGQRLTQRREPRRPGATESAVESPPTAATRIEIRLVDIGTRAPVGRIPITLRSAEEPGLA